MLTVEEIKKILDNFNVDGFEYHELGINSPDRYCIMWRELEDNYWTQIRYPLFLQRVKQGINKHCTLDYRIDSLGINLFVVFNPLNETVFNVHDTDNDLEEAIKYILGKINA